MENGSWTKYSYVCTGCDSLFEVTCKDPKSYEPLCCAFVARVSVEDATINTPTNEREKMETTQAPNTITVDFGNNIIKELTPQQIIYTYGENARLNSLISNNYAKESAVKEIITESFSDSEDQDTLRAIAEAMDIELTRTIEWTATIEVSGTMDIDILEDIDIEQEIYDNLYVDSQNGQIEIGDTEVTSAREC